MYLITYMDRSNISVAQPEIAKQFGLSKTAMGLVLAAFTWAYALGQVPSGWFGDRFGPKRVLTVIMTLWSATAVMTGAAFGFGSLFGARFLLGLSESGAFPVASRGMQLWFPRVERGRIQGTTHFFSRFAVAVTPFIAGSILLAFGWRAIFYIFGSLGVVWAIVFSIFYRDLPEDHKGVNRMELARIRGVNPDGTIKPPAISQLATPWKRILLSPNMWFISLGYFCFFFGTNFYLTWYPTYLREHLHMSIRSLGIWGSVPLFAGMAGDITGGSISDLIFKTTGKAKLARRVVAAPGFLLAERLRNSRRVDREQIQLDCVFGRIFLLPRMGDRSCVGRPHGCGRSIQRHGYGRDEHGRRPGRSVHSRRLRKSVQPRILGGAIPGECGRDGRGRADLDVPDQSRTVRGGEPGFAGQPLRLDASGGRVLFGLIRFADYYSMKSDSIHWTGEIR